VIQNSTSIEALAGLMKLPLTSSARADEPGPEG